MINPMMRQLNQGKMNYLLGNLGNIKRSVNALRSLGDPDKALQQLLQNSPQMKQALDYVNNNGGDPKAVCYKLIRDNGLDPNALEDALR